MMTQQRFTFPTSGGRFNLLDDGVPPIADAAWTGEAEGRRLGLGPGAMAIGTVDPVAQVAVTVTLHDREPTQAGLERWAFVVEGSVELAVGRLRVVSGGDGGRQAGEVMLEPNVYRVRVACDRGGGRCVVPGGTETYQVDLWPAPALSPRVLHSDDAAC